MTVTVAPIFEIEEINKELSSLFILDHIRNSKYMQTVLIQIVREAMDTRSYNQDLGYKKFYTEKRNSLSPETAMLVGEEIFFMEYIFQQLLRNKALFNVHNSPLNKFWEQLGRINYDEYTHETLIKNIFNGLFGAGFFKKYDRYLDENPLE